MASVLRETGVCVGDRVAAQVLDIWLCDSYDAYEDAFELEAIVASSLTAVSSLLLLLA